MKRETAEIYLQRFILRPQFGVKWEVRNRAFARFVDGDAVTYRCDYKLDAAYAVSSSSFTRVLFSSRCVSAFNDRPVRRVF